jgi:phosphoribosylglycinamide formyltransferase-1
MSAGQPSPRPPLSLAVLISGRGSNMTAIAHACAGGRIHARVARVISDRDSAGGIRLARDLGLCTAVVSPGRFDHRSAFEAALSAEIGASGAELVLLAGFMRILSAQFVGQHAGRILNIHPSLLPLYRGLHTHQRALAAGEREHGASVHFVTAELDGGPVIIRARVPILPGDTEDSLSARVQLQEHRIYPRAVGLIADGRLSVRGSTILLDGQPLAAPLEETPTDAPLSA